MCSRDVLFYFNTFLYTYDPRKMAALPFVTYPFQDEGICEVDCAIEEQYPLNIKKSRDMGVSWFVLGVYQWRITFKRWQQFLLLSRKQELVDKSGDPNSLFWKLDFMTKLLPKWMRPEVVRNELHLAVPANSTVIDGESTNKDAGRGGRSTSIAWDEKAATPNAYEVAAAIANNCDCVISIYTPKGTGTAAYASEETTRTVKLHWTLHPEHSRGLYTTRGGKIVTLDPDWSFPDNYPFVVDKEEKRRSVWYDQKCHELMDIPAYIAAELDMDDLASESQFFDIAFLDRYEAEQCMAPRFIGELDLDRDLCLPRQLLERDGGCLKVWGHVDKGGAGRPPADRTYTIGCDIAQGTGASNSTAVVTDDKTGEKVAEYANPNTKTHEFARYAAALGRFYAGPDGRAALLIWEDNGPGVNFGSVLKDDIKYENMWFRNDDTPGWAPTNEGKFDLLATYRAAQMDGFYIDRSADCVQEQREFMFFPDGTVAHRASRSKFDPSGARANHGDRVIATALSFKGVRSKRPPAPPKPKLETSLDTFYGRRLAYERKQSAANYWLGSSP